MSKTKENQKSCIFSFKFFYLFSITSILAIVLTNYFQLENKYLDHFSWEIFSLSYLQLLYSKLAESTKTPNKTKILLNAQLVNIFNDLVTIADQPLNDYKVAVGFGSCVDIFTDAVPLFDYLKFRAPKNNDEVEHYNVIDNSDQLTSGFTYFFTKGAASERYISNKQLFDQLVDTVMKNEEEILIKTIKKPKVALGGNAPVMANRFALELKKIEGYQGKILLAAQQSHEFDDYEWMDELVEFTGPRTEVADRHLILEYKTNEKYDNNRWVSPRANRFIVHSDNHNPYLTGIDQNFHQRFLDIKPNLLVISGLQMMDNIPYTSQERKNLIAKIANFCQTHRNIKTHFELASFVDENLVTELIQEIIPYSDSIGCNEQELPNIYAALTGKELIKVADSMPKVSNILEILRKTFQILNDPKNPIKPKNINSSEKSSSSNSNNFVLRPTSRIHVHTLAYQAIIQIDDQKTDQMWPNIEQAAAKATVTAIRHICQNDNVTYKSAKILLDNSFRISTEESNQRRVFIKEGEPVTCWTEDDPVIGKRIKICLAIGLVCTEVKQTAGGGDNISAGALAAQLP